MTDRLNPFLYLGVPPPTVVGVWAASGWRILDGFVDNDAGRLDGIVCIGRVDDPVAAGDAIEAAARGAAIAVDIDDGLLDLVVDDAVRLGQHPAPESGNTPEATVVNDWAPLLERLAAGDSVAVAARNCHMSVRSAYRRLTDARALYGVRSNTAAVVAWRRGTIIGH